MSAMWEWLRLRSPIVVRVWTRGAYNRSQWRRGKNAFQLGRDYERGMQKEQQSDLR